MKFKPLFLGLVITLLNVSPSYAGIMDWLFAKPEPLAVSHYPAAISGDCKSGRAFIYDECGSQQAHINEALKEAGETGKTVLVSYGAEWCIWCHVLDNYLRGKSGKFRYKLEDDVYYLDELATDKERQQAIELNKFAAENLIIVHLESRYSPDGRDVLEDLGAFDFYTGGVPYIFTVTKSGQYAASLPNWDDVPGLEVRHAGADWYRGFERSLLQQELAKLVQAAE